jgi:hypothetical protein
MKLMNSLDKIENKLDKESGSNKSGSHRTLEERGRSRSDNRHHHHSQRQSKRRAHRSSSPSPARKHKRSGVDELKGEKNKIKPPTFDGEHKKDEDAETWLLGMRKYFQLHNYSSHVEGRISIYQLKGKASMWWDQLVQVQHTLLHIEKFAMTTCDESTLSSQNSREKVQFFNFIINPARIRRSIDGSKCSSLLR